jgi:hypothetical protein
MIFDVANPPAQPDSNLDPDLTREQSFTIQDSSSKAIAPGDWVDVDPAVINPDPIWGYSFQVCNVYPEAGAVGILVMVDPVNDVYAETQLSAAAVTNNFRRMA